MADEELISIAEAARRIGINRATLARAARIGTLKAKRVGNVWAVTIAEAQRWIKEQYNPNMQRR